METIKTVAILGGGDWADASVAHLDMPKHVSIENAKKEYNKWYHEEYCSNLNTPTKIPYLSFTEWLKKHHQATDSMFVEEYWDY